MFLDDIDDQSIVNNDDHQDIIDINDDQDVILQSSMLYVANVAMIIAWKYAKDTKDESIKLVDQNDEAFNC